MRITDQYLKEVCKPGTFECCRYLSCGAKGFQCEKLGPMRGYLDNCVARNEMRAVGDNCEGLDNA